MDLEINNILTYWFEDPEPMKKWFHGGPTIDTEITSKFGHLVKKARASELESWTQNPKGTLALILLLDQFPRNIYRGTPAAFSSDGLALSIATKAIAQGFDREVEKNQRPFFYMPLMHAEDLLSQVACVAIYEVQARDAGNEDKEMAEKSVMFARKRMDCILRFGRFPSRNEVLGRVSTKEEIEYLEKSAPQGW